MFSMQADDSGYLEEIRTRYATEGAGLRGSVIPWRFGAAKASPHGVYVLPPERECVIERVDSLNLVVCDVRVDILQIPNEQIKGIIVVPRVDGLWKIDDDNSIFNIQNVVGGEIGVNAMLDQEQFDIAQNLLIDR
jgi:hypothetical protein